MRWRWRERSFHAGQAEQGCVYVLMLFVSNNYLLSWCILQTDMDSCDFYGDIVGAVGVVPLPSLMFCLLSMFPASVIVLFRLHSKLLIVIFVLCVIQTTQGTYHHKLPPAQQDYIWALGGFVFLFHFSRCN